MKAICCYGGDELCVYHSRTVFGRDASRQQTFTLKEHRASYKFFSATTDNENVAEILPEKQQRQEFLNSKCH